MAELETMLPVLWSQGVATGKLSVGRFVELTSTNAARLFGLYPRKGTIAPGADADLVVWNPNETRTVDGSTIRLNKVLDWFKDDFGGIDGLRVFLAPYLPDDAAALLADPNTSVEFFEYDWTLNDTGS